jgi:hypothetical protein
MNFAPKMSENLAKMIRKPFTISVSPGLGNRRGDRTSVSQKVTRHYPVSVFEPLERIGDRHQTRTHYCCLEG